jgi:hypothetical protein
MKRIAISAIALVALMVGLTGSASAATEGIPIFETSTVSFELTSDNCSFLPNDTKVKGSGPQLSVTTERTDRRGVRTIKNATNANGTAHDQNGNTYVFHYANQYHISNTPAHPDVFSGSMTDLFVLSGPGPARIRNGFVADLTTKADLSFVFFWMHPRAFGDPISFQPGPFVAHCDPL